MCVFVIFLQPDLFGVFVVNNNLFLVIISIFRIYRKVNRLFPIFTEFVGMHKAPTVSLSKMSIIGGVCLQPLAATVVEKIESLCARNGISVNAMLKACEIGKSFVDNIKKGSMPSIDKLNKIAEYFNVSTDYLLGKEDIEKALSSGNESALPIELKDMLMKFRILSPQAREDMIRYLGYLAQRDSQDNE